MRRDLEDLHAVRPEHVGIHKRLLNWSRCQKSGGWQTNCLSMFEGYRDNYFELSAPRDPPNVLDSQKVQNAFKEMPEIHRHAIGWAYVRYGYPVHLICRDLQVRRSELADLIHSGRGRIVANIGDSGSDQA